MIFFIALCLLDQDGLIPHSAGLAAGKLVGIAQEIIPVNAEDSPVIRNIMRLGASIKAGFLAGFGNTKGGGNVSFWSDEAQDWITVANDE